MFMVGAGFSRASGRKPDAWISTFEPGEFSSNMANKSREAADAQLGPGLAGFCGLPWKSVKGLNLKGACMLNPSGLSQRILPRVGRKKRGQPGS